MVKVALKSVCKSFDGVEVLSDVSLSIDNGSFVAFVGPSGCGKSTLLRVIAGLESADSGDINFDDRRMNDVPAPERSAAMVFQSYALYPHMTVWENMSFSLRIQGQNKTTRRAKAAKVAELLQLTDFLDRRPAALSGGQRQRVAIGRALLRDPEVFLFDEPLSNLDAALRGDMRVELADLHRRIGNTMIYVTHDQIEAMTMADSMVVLKKGRIEQTGAPLDIYNRPANAFVAGFIGNPRMNFFKVVVNDVSDKGVTIALPEGQELTVPVSGAGITSGQALTLGVRPEHVAIDEGDAILNVTPNLVEKLGIHTLAYADLEGAPARFCALFEGSLPIKEGASMRMGLVGSKCHLFDEQDIALEHLD